MAMCPSHTSWCRRVWNVHSWVRQHQRCAVLGLLFMKLASRDRSEAPSYLCSFGLPKLAGVV